MCQPRRSQKEILVTNSASMQEYSEFIVNLYKRYLTNQNRCLSGFASPLPLPELDPHGPNPLADMTHRGSNLLAVFSGPLSRIWNLCIILRDHCNLKRESSQLHINRRNVLKGTRSAGVQLNPPWHRRCEGTFETVRLREKSFQPPAENCSTGGSKICSTGGRANFRTEFFVIPYALARDEINTIYFSSIVAWPSLYLPSFYSSNCNGMDNFTVRLRGSAGRF